MTRLMIIIIFLMAFAVAIVPGKGYTTDDGQIENANTAKSGLSFSMPIKVGTCFTIRMEQFGRRFEHTTREELRPDPDAKPVAIYDLKMEITALKDIGDGQQEATIECYKAELVKGDPKYKLPLPFKLTKVIYKNGAMLPGCKIRKMIPDPQGGEQLVWNNVEDEMSYYWASGSNANPWTLWLALLPPDQSKSSGIIASGDGPPKWRICQDISELATGSSAYITRREGSPAPEPLELYWIQTWPKGSFWWSQSEYYELGKFLYIRETLTEISQPLTDEPAGPPPEPPKADEKPAPPAGGEPAPPAEGGTNPPASGGETQP